MTLQDVALVCIGVFVSLLAALLACRPPEPRN